MKKASLIIAMILSLSMLCACGTNQAAPANTPDVTAAPEVTTAPEATPEVTAAPAESPAAVPAATAPQEVDYNTAYASVLTAYRDALAANAGEGDLLGSGLSPLCIYSGEDKLSSVGFIFTDLDGDGVKELLIGQISGDEFTDKVVYDAYTLKDGAPVQLFVSSERNRYYLYNGNLIANEGSSGADSSESSLFTLSGGQLVAGAGAPDAANYIKPEYTSFSNY